MKKEKSTLLDELPYLKKTSSVSNQSTDRIDSQYGEDENNKKQSLQNTMKKFKIGYQKSITSFEDYKQKKTHNFKKLEKKSDMNVTYQNFQFLFGCRPSKTVNADTDMVNEIIDTF